jgi:DNA repair protein RadC
MDQLSLDFNKPRPDARFRYRLELAEEAIVPYHDDVRLTRPGEVAKFLFQRIFLREPREVVAVLFLDTQQQVIGHHIAYTGTLNRAPIEPRQIFACALLRNAAGIIVAHNHPSGVTDPSQEDINATRRLEQAGDLLGVRLHDHMIIGGEGRWRSLKAVAAW